MDLSDQFREWLSDWQEQRIRQRFDYIFADEIERAGTPEQIQEIEDKRERINKALKSDNYRPDGEKAQALVELEWRDAEADYPVGQTPKKYQ